MDYLDIILYIVFAIIGIFSSINSSRVKKQTEKRRQTQPAAGRGEVSAPAEVVAPEDDMVEYDQPTSEEMSLDDIFKALREGIPLEKVRKVEPVVEPQPVLSPIEPVEEGMRVTPNENFVNDEISDRGVYTEDDRSEVFSAENVDWRQAVITSEILNRKY